MRTTILALLSALASSVGAADIQPVPAPVYLDGESEASSAARQPTHSKSGYGFSIDFTGTPSNNVNVAVGADSDGDGQLSFYETAVTAGWDCGRYFVEQNGCGWRHEFPAITTRDRRSLSYRCRVKGRKLLSFSLLTDEGEVGPFVSDTTTVHTVSFRYAASMTATGNLARIRNVRLLRGIRAKTGTGPLDPVAVAVGCPDLRFQYSGGRVIPNDGYVELSVPDQDLPGSVELSTQVVGSGSVLFEWSTSIDKLSVRVDGVEVGSIEGNHPEFVGYGCSTGPIDWGDLRYPPDKTRHTVRWELYCGYLAGYNDRDISISAFELGAGLFVPDPSYSTPMGTAVGVPGLQFRQYSLTPGDGRWYVDGNSIFGAVDVDYGIVVLETSVIGNGSLSFDWWLRRSYSGIVDCSFYVDGIRVGQIDAGASFDRSGRTTLTIPEPDNRTYRLWSGDWDTIKVTTRGVGASEASASYRFDQSGGIMMFK